MLDLVKDELPAGYAYSKLFVKYFTEKSSVPFWTPQRDSGRVRFTWGH